MCDSFFVQRGEGYFDHAIIGEAIAFEGIAVVSGFAQVVARKVVCIGNDDAAVWKVVDIGFECCRVHRHEDLWLVAGRVYVFAGYVDLKPANAGQCAGGRADFSGKVRQGADVIADYCRGIGKFFAYELAAITGITCKANGNGFDFGQFEKCRFGRFFNVYFGHKSSWSFLGTIPSTGKVVGGWR